MRMIGWKKSAIKPLDLRKDDGDVEDTLAEMRKRWGKDVPILKDKRFDEIITQYFCLSHEAGIAALGQELTAYGYALYDLDGDEILPIGVASTNGNADL